MQYNCGAMCFLKVSDEENQSAGAQVSKIHVVLTAFSICMCTQPQPSAGSLQVEEMGQEDGPCPITLLGPVELLCNSYTST